jgi:hypothetical protein
MSYLCCCYCVHISILCVHMSEFIKFRASPQEQADFKAAATQAGLSLSEWIRTRCKINQFFEGIKDVDTPPIKPVATKKGKPFVCLLKGVKP